VLDPNSDVVRAGGVRIFIRNGCPGSYETTISVNMRFRTNTRRGGGFLQATKTKASWFYWDPTTSLAPIPDGDLASAPSGYTTDWITNSESDSLSFTIDGSQDNEHEIVFLDPGVAVSGNVPSDYSIMWFEVKINSPIKLTKPDGSVENLTFKGSWESGY